MVISHSTGFMYVSIYRINQCLKLIAEKLLYSAHQRYLCLLVLIELD